MAATEGTPLGVGAELHRSWTRQVKLSPHFTLEEMTRSDWAARNGVRNDPSPEHVENLKRLCVEVLEPIRDAVKAPIFVTSGYRSLTVNRAAGGALASAHMDGRAADFVVGGMSIEVASLVVRNACRTLPVGKLIQEFGRWLHVQIDLVGEPRRQWLQAYSKDGRTTYQEWI